MDIVHHTAIGVVGYVGLASYDQELAGMAFVAGSVFPDLDALLCVFGKRFYLRHHQEITHSIPLSPIYALLISAPLLSIGAPAPAILACAVLGLWLHVLLDYTNTFGTAVFWPISGSRFSCDAVFFVDACAWAITLFALLSAFIFSPRIAIPAWATAFALYLAIRIVLHGRVVRRLGCSFAIPSSLKPFEYFVLHESDRGPHGYLYSLIGHEKRERFDLDPTLGTHAALTAKSAVFSDMCTIAKALRVTQAEQSSEGLRLTASDVAVRNFGGRFGRTELLFDREGNLVRETADI